MLAAANYLIDKGDDNHMTESPDILKLRVLLCFLKSAPEHCTVTGISRTLNEEKYTISRSLRAGEGRSYRPNRRQASVIDGKRQ